MDFIFLDQYDYIPGEILFVEEAIPVVKQSAFVKYVNNRPIQEVINGRREDDRRRRRSMNVRMIEFLRRNPVRAAGDEEYSERERGRRHMISERIRREKQKNCFSSLHSVLPSGTKNDKKSIVQVAAKEVEELRRWKEELKRQNNELERRVLANGKKIGEEKQEEEELKGGANSSKIKMKVAYPSSGIDSMLGALKCLKETGSNPTSIHSKFSPNEISAVFHVQNKKMEGEQVEKAVQRSLYEVETKFRFQFPQGWKKKRSHQP